MQLALKSIEYGYNIYEFEESFFQWLRLCHSRKIEHF